MSTIARWESRSGKHWVELRDVSNEHGACFAYVAPDCGGTLAAKTVHDARAEMDRRVTSGYFQPDANRTSMKLVMDKSELIEAIEDL